MALALIPAISLLSGCLQKEFSFDYADHLGNITPCIVEQDTTVVILRDYFPKMNDMDTLTIMTSAEAPFLVMYECYDTIDGMDKFCPLLVKNAIPAKLEGADKSKAPKMSTFPAGSSGKDFFIKIEGGMQQLVILWEGRILERGRHFDLLSDSLVRVRAPRAARKVERSHIQAFVANASGVGNDILVPLEYGKVVRDPVYLKRTDKHYQILDSLPGKSLYQIGETYGSLSLISLYVKPGMLDGQFDFNVYDTYIWATTRPEGSFESLAGCIDANLDVYGYHNLMGYISGNHDRSRYVSLASGDVKHDEDQKLAGWKRNIVVSDTMAYRKLAMLHALNLTLPGVPCIYYGDEYGQPGANDPDNRRWMEFEGYSSYEQQVADAVKELTHLRRSSMPLMYGDYFRLAAENDIFAFMRSYMGEAVITFLNKSADSREVSVSLPFGLEYNGSSIVNVKLEPYSHLIIETNK